MSPPTPQSVCSADQSGQGSTAKQPEQRKLPLTRVAGQRRPLQFRTGLLALPRVPTGRGRLGHCGGRGGGQGLVLAAPEAPACPLAAAAGAARGINVRLHLTRGMREFIDANAEWLTVFQLPVYAPDLNPTEGIWSLVKRDIGNLAAAGLSQITRAVKRRLKRIQYRPALVDGCLAETGLIMDD
ncbi:transposase [Streptomyces mirabilis]